MSRTFETEDLRVEVESVEGSRAATAYDARGARILSVEVSIANAEIRAAGEDVGPDYTFDPPLEEIPTVEDTAALAFLLAGGVAGATDKGSGFVRKDEPGCDVIPEFLESNGRRKRCCVDHDVCFHVHGCSAASLVEWIARGTAVVVTSGLEVEVSNCFGCNDAVALCLLTPSVDPMAELPCYDADCLNSPPSRRSDPRIVNLGLFTCEGKTGYPATSCECPSPCEQDDCRIAAPCCSRVPAPENSQVGDPSRFAEERGLCARIESMPGSASRSDRERCREFLDSPLCAGIGGALGAGGATGMGGRAGASGTPGTGGVPGNGGTRGAVCGACDFLCNTRCVAPRNPNSACVEVCERGIAPECECLYRSYLGCLNEVRSGLRPGSPLQICGTYEDWKCDGEEEIFNACQWRAALGAECNFERCFNEPAVRQACEEAVSRCDITNGTAAVRACADEARRQCFDDVGRIR
jgi:hypothetical protein